jgi:hypothetical protein
VEKKLKYESPLEFLRVPKNKYEWTNRTVITSRTKPTKASVELIKVFRTSTKAFASSATPNLFQIPTPTRNAGRQWIRSCVRTISRMRVTTPSARCCTFDIHHEISGSPNVDSVMKFSVFQSQNLREVESERCRGGKFLLNHKHWISTEHPDKPHKHQKTSKSSSLSD